jgi:hypothetical protein
METDQSQSLALTTNKPPLAGFRTAVDVVVITAPSGLHYELCKRTLSAGKHVLCEKPVTTTEAEALELVELAHRVRSHGLLRPDVQLTSLNLTWVLSIPISVQNVRNFAPI